jgi:hypothetical protein
VRFRENSEKEQAKAREAVKAWRAGHPDGTPAEMLAELGPEFHADYGPVLRAMLFRADLRDAQVTTGTTVIAGEADR